MQQIDHRVIKLLVGLIAISLAVFMQLASGEDLSSISESYHHERSRDWFVGLLFAVGALFVSFKGENGFERKLTILAGLCATLVAVAPCICESDTPSATSLLHYPAAGGVFLILGYFCWRFRRSALDKTASYPEAKYRGWVYTACLAAMAGCGLAAAAFGLSGKLAASFPQHVFWIEGIWLMSFGASWLAASRTLPVITNPNERFRLLDGSAPEDRKKSPPDPNDPAS